MLEVYGLLRAFTGKCPQSTIKLGLYQGLNTRAQVLNNQKPVDRMDVPDTTPQTIAFRAFRDVAHKTIKLNARAWTLKSALQQKYGKVLHAEWATQAARSATAECAL